METYWVENLKFNNFVSKCVTVGQCQWTPRRKDSNCLQTHLDVWHINILESIVTCNLPIILWNMNNWCHIWTKKLLYISVLQNLNMFLNVPSSMVILWTYYIKRCDIWYWMMWKALVIRKWQRAFHQLAAMLNIWL